MRKNKSYFDVDAIRQQLAQIKFNELNEPINRRNESHENSVKRYIDHPKDETMEERAERINRFRCGY